MRRKVLAGKRERENGRNEGTSNAKRKDANPEVGSQKKKLGDGLMAVYPPDKIRPTK